MEYQSLVLQGDKKGRLINFPTVNLDPKVIPSDTKQGVYRATVQMGEESYEGALYYGPRLVFGETKLVLEIHILDFDRDMYGEQIFFSINEFIRPPQNYENMEALSKAIENDIAKIRELSQNNL